MDTNSTCGSLTVRQAVVAGARHLRQGKGCQDAAATAGWRGGVVAVVSDGCSSAASSEIGARLAAPLLAREVARRLDLGAVPARPTVDGCVREVLGGLLAFLQAPAPSRQQAIADYLLFTLVVAIVSEARALVVAYGDGQVLANGNSHVFGPFADNAPPYPGYALIEGQPPLPPPLELLFEGDAASLLVIGTDGLTELLGHAAERPEAREILDPLRGATALPSAQALQRRLLAHQRERLAVNWEAARVERRRALLSDDLAFVVIARPGGSR